MLLCFIKIFKKQYKTFAVYSFYDYLYIFMVIFFIQPIKYNFILQKNIYKNKTEHKNQKNIKNKIPKQEAIKIVVENLYWFDGEKW